MRYSFVVLPVCLLFVSITHGVYRCGKARTSLKKITTFARWLFNLIFLGRGPHQLALSSESFTVYQRRHWIVAIGHNNSANAMNVLHWILNPATTQISEEELAKIANAQSKLINIARQTRQLRVNVTQKLDGLNVAFQLEHSNGNNANITHERSPWVTVKLGGKRNTVAEV